jgi:hypothetical protein
MDYMDYKVTMQVAILHTASFKLSNTCTCKPLAKGIVFRYLNQVDLGYKPLICRFFPNKKDIYALCRQGLVYTLHFACKLRSGDGSIPGIFQLSLPPQTQRPAAGMLSFALSMKYYCLGGNG